MFSYVSPEQRIPKGHPLRAIRALVNKVFVDTSREFDRLYATIGRPSIPPRAIAARTVVADLLLDLQRAVANGAAGLQPAVSLIRGSHDG